MHFWWKSFEDLHVEDSQALTYVSGYLLRKIDIPHKNCLTCLTDLFFKDMRQQHLFTSFKENSDKTSLTYASDQVIILTENIHNMLYSF